MAQEIVGSRMPAKNSYGQNGYAGPSSATDVKSSSKLSALDINTDDAALDQLIDRGSRPKENDAAQPGLTGQERPISDTPFPATHGAVRQQAPETVFGKVAKELPQGDTYGDAEPVREP